MAEAVHHLTAAPHTLAVDTVLQIMGSDRSAGLDTSEAAARLVRYGYNQLAEASPPPLWRKLLRQFRELVVWILIAAAVIAGVTGEWADTLAILAIVFLNAILGFLQEEKAERALAALRQMSAPFAKVVRGGERQSLPARELVPGDRIELEAGDNIPADSRLIDAFSLRVQEAALTGESVPVDKDPRGVLSETTALGERGNMAYMGTVVAAGRGSAVVVATGMQTELGRIAGMLEASQPEPTPLQRRLAELGKVLVVVCLVIVGFIFLMELQRGGAFLEVLLLAVSLAVAAVPEGLPAVVTIALALGLQRMIKRNALIRRLPSVETLGSVTVICSDKTGTLTRNEMTVREIVAGDGRYQVTGIGYAPRGGFLKLREGPAPAGHGGAVQSPRAADDRLDYEPVDPRGECDLIQALTIAAWCNNASVSPRGNGGEAWQVIGDPTEGALIVAAMKAEIEAGDQPHAKLFEIPFDSERKAMSVVVSRPEAARVMYTKGALDTILPACVAERRAGAIEPLTTARRDTIMQINADMAARALRVLALAYRAVADAGVESYRETDLIFAGLIGMIDPPRDEAKTAVQKCRQAGIRPIMITGDHAATALAIARELRLGTNGAGVVSGQDLDAMSDDQLVARVADIAVYARVSAAHKLRVVQAWKKQGQVVAMTGDGVNDAPALKAADIGIAMGVAGTDVTKEAADMVLTDDNFASIVNAVEEGRGIFDNIQKVVHYLLSCNAGEVLLMFVAVLAGWPAPLLPIQILWINLVTDGLPALALGMESPERDIMVRPPRPPREPVITPAAGLRMLVHGTLIATVALLGFAWVHQGDHRHLEQARSVAFCITAYAQLFYSFGCRSQRRTVPELGFFTNPLLLGAIAVSGLLQLSVVTLPFAQPVFEVPASFALEWALILVLALTPVTLIECTKLVRAFVWRRPRRPPP